ncbi:MAG: 5-guanidino-2-oxopentanoate decarboxylase [Rhodobacter sp.]|nr:5-guanidino-2-oxopentanoate decarboxylase [Rhodobacter sp.]
MARRPLGAQISAMLASRGIDTVFGIPGVHNIELYRGLEESGLRHILARHEQGAGFMADGYARATGRPGVAYVITGPGLTNIMTPMGQAYSDSVPLLVISSCLDEAAATRGQLHQMRDQEAAARTVCDWSETARTAEAAYALIDRALTEFETTRRRSRHIQIPIGVLGKPAPPAPAQSSLTAPDTISIEAALRPIMAARRPLFIFGGGCRYAASDARRVVAKLGAATFLTYAGRGVIAPEYPLNFGSYLARPDSVDAIASADLVVAVGTELSETDLWRAELGHSGPLIRVDRDPGEMSDPGALNIVCDAGAFLRKLLEMCEGHHADTGWRAKEVADARSRWRAASNAERPGIVAISDALRDCLPDDTMVFSDMTQFAYVAKEVWDMPAPGLWHHPCGFGTLGYALPAAIGGKVGVGGQPVVAIAGDYGFQYTLQELGTAAELGLSLPILLWDNGMLKEIEACMTGSQIAPVAVQALNPDFGTLAAAYGIGYAKPATLADLQARVGAALTADMPTIIHMTPEITG